MRPIGFNVEDTEDDEQIGTLDINTEEEGGNMGRVLQNALIFLAITAGLAILINYIIPTIKITCG